jgi:acetyl esterase
MPVAPLGVSLIGQDPHELLDALPEQLAGRLLRDQEVELPCRNCGCTDSHACAGGCSWTEPGLCSACTTVAAATPQDERRQPPGRRSAPELGACAGNLYLERGVPVTVERGWRDPGPRNVLIVRADGERVVRPFRGLRRP